MKATVKKITEIYRTRMIEDDWVDEYTEGMELLGGESIEIRPMVIDGRTSAVWFEGAKDLHQHSLQFSNKFAMFNWHRDWLKDFQDEV